jgi:hypothetical protein
MNLKLTFHLLKIEWLRLKTPIIILWLLVLYGSLPWVFSGSRSYIPFAYWRVIPLDFHDASMNQLHQIGNSLSHPATLIALMTMGIGIATSLKWDGISHALTIRKRELVLSKALLITLCLILPQTLALAGVLEVQGFSTGEIYLSAWEQFSTDFIRLSACSLLAAWCGSSWLFIAVVSCLIIIPKTVPGWMAESLSEGMIHYQGYLPSNLMLHFTGWSLFTMSLSFPWLHKKLGNTGKVVTAVFLISGFELISRATDLIEGRRFFLEALIESLKTHPKHSEEPGSAITLSSVKPHLRSQNLEPTSAPLNLIYGRDHVMTLTTELATEGCPPNCGVIWKSSGVQETRDGDKTIGKSSPALERANAYYQNLIQAGFTKFIQPQIQKDLPRLIGALLPEGTRLIDPYSDQRGAYENKPDCYFPIPISFHEGNTPAGSATTLQSGITGSVYQWKKVLDLELSENPQTGTEGYIHWGARRHPSTSLDELQIELTAKFIEAMHLAEHSYRAPSIALPHRSHVFLLYLPSSAAAIRIEPVYCAYTPITPQATCCQYLLKVQRKQIEDRGARYDLQGARILAFHSEFIGETPETRIEIPLIANGENHSVTTNRILEKNHANPFLTGSPDPDTCSTEEFMKWVRTPSGISNGKSISIEWSCYASRFGSILVDQLHFDGYTGDLSLTKGLHESQASEVVERIRTSPDPQLWADTALNRGWTGQAKDALLRRFQANELRFSNSIMDLEDPATYPLLIERLLQKPDPAIYERLRLLPGIEPILSGKIAMAAKQADLHLLEIEATKPSPNPVDYGPFLLDAKQGNVSSLIATLRILNSSKTRLRNYHYTESQNISWLGDFMSDPQNQKVVQQKKPEDFRYDPLSRSWSLK